MNGFNMYVGSIPKSADTSVMDQKKPSFIPNMDALKKTKTAKKPMKKVNTKVPKQVLTSFLMYCIQENLFRKEAFSVMLRLFLEKSKKQPFSIVDTINGVPINFKDVEEANFEFDLALFSGVQEFKVVNRLTYIDVYTQVIAQYLEGKYLGNKQSI